MEALQRQYPIVKTSKAPREKADQQTSMTPEMTEIFNRSESINSKKTFEMLIATYPIANRKMINGIIERSATTKSLGNST